MEYIVNSNDLTAVADAIREKCGTSEPLSFPDDYISAIEAISTTHSVTVIPTNVIEVDKSEAASGETVIVTVIRSGPMEPGTSLCVYDSERVTLITLSSSSTLTSGETFTFVMPSQDVNVGFN